MKIYKGIAPPTSMHFLIDIFCDRSIFYRLPAVCPSDLVPRGTHHDEVSADFSHESGDIFRPPPLPGPVQPPAICSSRSQANNFITLALQSLTDLSQPTDTDSDASLPLSPLAYDDDSNRKITGPSH